MSKVKITKFRLENVKRVQAVEVVPYADGLTLIGGNNAEGKSSVLDGIMGALGGDKYKPSSPVHDGSGGAQSEITLSNGLEVLRRYTPAGGSYLTVTDAAGVKAGQTLLNEFLEELALNLGQFLRATPKDKAKTLMKAVGIDTQPFDEKIKNLMDERLLKGRERDNAKGHAESLPFHEGLGLEKVETTEVVERIQKVQKANADREALRQSAVSKQELLAAARKAEDGTKAEIARLESELTRQRGIAAEQSAEQARLADEIMQLAESFKSSADVDTTPMFAELSEIEATNKRIDENIAKMRARNNADALAEEYTEMTREIEQLRRELKALLDDNPLPLEGLAIQDGELVYKDRLWDSMSGAERLKVATAVVHLVKPTCGFVLLDGLEQMDIPTLQEFGAWLQDRGLQAIGTRVSTGSECSLIIEDGVGSFDATETVENTTTKENE